MNRYKAGIKPWNFPIILCDGEELELCEVAYRLNQLEYENDHYMRTLELILCIANTAPRDEQIAYYAENVLRLSKSDNTQVNSSRNCSPHYNPISVKGE